jgi:hypothetical protein
VSPSVHAASSPDPLSRHRSALAPSSSPCARQHTLSRVDGCAVAVLPSGTVVVGQGSGRLFPSVLVPVGAARVGHIGRPPPVRMSRSRGTGETVTARLCGWWSGSRFRRPRPGRRWRERAGGAGVAGHAP